MFTSRNGSRVGLRDEQAEHVSNKMFKRLGCAKQLKMATWNCGGLQDEVKQLCFRAGNIMPSKDPNDARFTTSEQLADAWYKFMENKFSCVDNPGAAYTPSHQPLLC